MSNCKQGGPIYSHAKTINTNVNVSPSLMGKVQMLIALWITSGAGKRGVSTGGDMCYERFSWQITLNQYLNCYFL